MFSSFAEKLLQREGRNIRTASKTIGDNQLQSLWQKLHIYDVSIQRFSIQIDHIFPLELDPQIGSAQVGDKLRKVVCVTGCVLADAVLVAIPLKAFTAAEIT